ncbi:MAG: extracellular solute-binding protein, partial [Pseudomonadota bacterium]
AYPYLLFFNREMVAADAVAAIRTWDDLARLAASAAQGERDKRRDGQPIFGLDIHSDLVWFQTWLWQRGGDLVAGSQVPGNQKTIADTLAAMAAWRRLPSFLPRPQDRLHLPSQGASQGVLGSLFLQGRAAFYWSGSWKMWDLAQQTRVPWGVCAIPRGPCNAQTLLGGNSFGAFRGTRHPDLAVRLVRYLASRAGEEAHMAAGIYFPSRPDVAVPPPACAVRGALDKGRTQDYSPHLNEALLEDSLYGILEAHRLGGLDAEQAAEQIDQTLRSADSGDQS